MKTRFEYDQITDALYISYSHKKVDKTFEVSDTFIIDLDENGELRGIEILDISDVIGEARMTKMTKRREGKISNVLLKEFTEKCIVPS